VTTLKRRVIQQSWVIFKVHLLQAQEWSILMSPKSSTDNRRPAWINKENLNKPRNKKQAYKRWNQIQLTWKEYRDTI